MKMHGAVGTTPLDVSPGIVGKPLDRVDGRAKVTGAARYAHEVPQTAPLYGFIVQSTIGHGRIDTLDTGSATRMPGVRAVLTHRDMPEQGAGEHTKAAPQMTGPDIHNFGQPIALVVADTFEQARDAAFRVVATYVAAPLRVDLRSAAGDAVTPKPAHGQEPDSEVGQFGLAFGAAAVQVDESYTTPLQSHAAMEPHATIARWDSDLLILENANQFVSQSQKVVAHTLQMPVEKVRLISKFVGGGFGSKLWVGSDCILAAVAAKRTGRPVKLAMTRPQIFHVTTHRSDTIQRVRLGADKDGRLLAIGHDALSGNRVGEPQYEGAALQTRSMYAAANRQTRHRLAALTIPVASSMRAPGEAVGMLALECAMDELAEKLGMDPIELRVRNEPVEDPEKRVPYSTRHLLACLREGAERFGWAGRGAVASRTDGQWLVGMGVAAAIRNNPLMASKARVRLDPDGVLTVQMAMTDIGTGTYTILTQVAASMMGIGPDHVRMELGDSALPMAAGSGGSFGAGSSGSALYDACMVLRAKLEGAAGFEPGSGRFEDGAVISGERRHAIAALAPAGGLVADGEIVPGDNRKEYSQQAYGANFAEVGVDRDTGEVRVRRMLGVFTAGRILNAKTARSQAIGGMVWGIGSALHEHLVLDSRTGHYVNHDLAEYHVPVHADVPELEAVFLPELDDKANPLKSKGLGELSISGAGAAVANAVFHATGARVRAYPLTPDRVMAAMEARS